MKVAILLAAILLLSTPLYEAGIQNFYYSNKTISIENFDGSDGAHFKYYENDSHIAYWYEWWYFNVKGKDKALLLYFFTFGNLNRFPKVGAIAAFFIKNESYESMTINPFNYNLDYEKFNITIGESRAWEDNGYFVHYRARNMEVMAEIHSIGKPFGGKPTMLKNWQWMAWYVAVPCGNADVTVRVKGGEYRFNGIAYHDHNWGIAKPFQLKWDWGEFCDGNNAIIYGMADGIGGIYFVNESTVSQHDIKIKYEKWVLINGFLKPSSLHIFSPDKNIDLEVKMEKAYMLGIKKFGKPYLLGKMEGKFYNTFFHATGFYEHHGIFMKTDSIMQKSLFNFQFFLLYKE